MTPRARSPQHLAFALFSLALCFAPLAACGGGGGSAPGPEQEGGGGRRADAEAGDASRQREGGLAVVDPQDPAMPNYVDFGRLPFGETARRTVRLENREGRALLVRNVLPGCSCTVPSISYTGEDGRRVEGDIRPGRDVLLLPEGAVAELELALDTRHAPIRNKDKLVLVRITTDSDVDPYLTLEVHMFVTSDFAATPPVIDLREVAIHGGGAGRTEIVAAGDSGRRIAGLLPAPEDVEVELEHVTFGDRDVWVLSARLVPPLQLGLLERTLRLATTGPGGEGQGEPLEVKLRASGVPDVQVRPARLALVSTGALPAGEVEVYSHLAGNPLLITRATLTGEQSELLEIALEPFAPDAEGRSRQWIVRVHATEALEPGQHSGMLLLELDDPQTPELRVPWMVIGR